MSAVCSVQCAGDTYTGTYSTYTVDHTMDQGRLNNVSRLAGAGLVLQ